MNKSYQLPALFVRDHLNRCDECYENPVKVIKWGKLIASVCLDDSTYADLLSDAEVYENMKGTEDYAENKSIVNSAIRTIAKLKGNE